MAKVNSVRAILQIGTFGYPSQGHRTVEDSYVFQESAMTLAKKLEHSAAKLSRHFDRRIETVDAVFDDQLWEILKSFGLLEQLDAGQLTCYRSGIPLTRDNVGGLVITPDGPKIISDSAMTEPHSSDASKP